jgi:chromate transporter
MVVAGSHAIGNLDVSIPFAAALRFWLKLGFISFGGPAGQIAIMHQELVERRRWISERRFLHALNFCMLLPGPEAQQLATYIGWLMHRTWGGLVAGGLFVLPSLVILTAFSWVYVAYGDMPVISALFFGIKPAVVAIVAFAAYRIGSRVIRNILLFFISAGAFVAIFLLHVPFPGIVVCAGILGYVGGRLAPKMFEIKAGQANSAQDYGPALIDDETPVPAHARFRWSRLLTIILAAVLAWAAPIATLVVMNGTSGVLPQMGRFFTKAALLTFGGAYAVLPYVYQGAVVHYGWLSPLQMIDGLALGETTPGPLIMVVAFVGFVGAWSHGASPALTPALAGVLGSLCATYFTFLPSFFLIFLGAPLIEASRGNFKLNAALTGITAAVVGVILNLAVFFAYHVFWPRGFEGPFQWLAALIGVASAVALFRFNVGTIPVVMASGLAGILIRFIMAQ